MLNGPRIRKQSVNLILTVLNITAPVFLLATVGYVWVKLGFEYRVAFVTRLAMTLSVPCLIFVALMNTQINPEALAALTLASFTAYGFVAVGSFILVKLGRLDVQTYLAPVVFAVMAILSFTVGVWLVSGGGSLTKVIKEPLVAATLLGALFLWQGWQTPTFLTNTLELIGQMAIPIMLITLGVGHILHAGRKIWGRCAACGGACRGVNGAVSGHFTAHSGICDITAAN